jgi:hypothetical protein
VKESIASGIPMIVWPLVSDESINAALVSCGSRPLDFELTQVGLLLD